MDNIKYHCVDGREQIFYYDGEINNTPEDRGSFNFCPPNVNELGHFQKDIVPWIIWGNDPRDRTTVLGRLGRFVLIGGPLKLRDAHVSVGKDIYNYLF